ncbi:hypothetical protein [Criblamydia sequanensis]|uniref:Biopolymer transport protein TolA n=1 Tax=Candidatus Criblamydia sequanensis CRIB-18 TaxID=1437425 RepID=A0A090D2R8_9BACT|nr:hypothetical protein [Criblamydia sequanensis]CDR34598.1 Putative biopolymer transport protein TolA [Criblamydia sequanensis CRIB-18]
MYEQLIKSFEKGDLRLAAITLLVVIIHGSFGLLSFIEAPKKVIKNKPLFVSTISLTQEVEIKTEVQEIKEHAAINEKESPKEKSTPKTVEKTPPKKETIVQPKKVTPAKKEIPKPATPIAPKKETSLKKDKLKEAKERMAKVNSQNSVKNETLNASPERKALGELNANKISDLKLTSALSHKDEVALVLKRELKLPDYGEVEISLTLKSNGQLVKADIVKTKSEVNSLYIKEGVSHLKFPPSKNETNNVTYLFTLTNE